MRPGGMSESKQPGAGPWGLSLALWLGSGLDLLLEAPDSAPPCSVCRLPTPHRMKSNPALTFKAQHRVSLLAVLSSTSLAMRTRSFWVAQSSSSY